MAKNTICSDICCRHHQQGDVCGTDMQIGANAHCQSFEPGLPYYFNLVWQALRGSNFINMPDMTPSLRIGLYCVMTAYHLGFSEMEWGTCRMIALRAGKDGPMLKASDILALPIDPIQVQKLIQELESGTLTTPTPRTPAPKHSQPFGWLSPSGDFTEGDFGDHDMVAGSIIQKKGLDEEYRAWRASRSGTCRDFLSEVKGYCLIHNPLGSGGYIVSNVKPLTKRQRDFLFEYFMELGDRFKAEQFLPAEG